MWEKTKLPIRRTLACLPRSIRLRAKLAGSICRAMACHRSTGLPWTFICSSARYLDVWAAIRTRVSCWLVTSQGIVDLLSPLCCLLRPPCTGCFFAAPPAQQNEDLARLPQAQRCISVSPPITALEACRLIQRAKDRVDDIRGTLSDAPTM